MESEGSYKVQKVCSYIYKCLPLGYLDDQSINVLYKKKKSSFVDSILKNLS